MKTAKVFGWTLPFHWIAALTGRGQSGRIPSKSRRFVTCGRRIRAYCAARLPLWAALVFAQGSLLCPAAPATGLASRAWQTKDGLPENTVQAFAQTADGFLWAGTTGGLVRFDGDSFTTFDHSTAPAFEESDVLSLLVTSDGSLWIGTDGGGLIRYRDGIFSHFAAPQGLDDGFVRAIFEDRERRLWVGTGSGLFRWNGDARRPFTRIRGSAVADVQMLYEDRGSNLWVAGSQLYQLRNGRLQAQRFRNRDSKDDPIKAMIQSGDGTLWVGSLSGLSSRKKNQKDFVHLNGITGAVTSLLIADNSTLWIGTASDGLFTLKNHVLARANAFPAAPRTSILSLFQDSGHDIWIGTQAGLVELIHSPVSIIHFPKGATSDSATVYVDRHNTVWVASRRLYTVHGKSLTPVSIPQLADVNIQCVWSDKDDSLWLGTNGDGIYHVTQKGAVHYTTQNGLVNNFIRVIIGGRDDTVWVGTDSGVSYYLHGVMRHLGIGDSLRNESIRAIHPDRFGDVWIGGSLGLSRLHNGKFVENAITKALRSEKVWSIYEGSRGTFWFGTRYGGLYGFQNNRVVHFTTAQGLISDSIYKMVGDGKGGLWLSGPAGISSLSMNDLYAFGETGVRDLHPRTYYISDGQQTVQFYGGTQPAGWNGASGDIWFSSNHGPVHIIPDHDSPPLPRLRIKRIVVDGRTIDEGNKVVLGPDDTTLEINYAPILLKPQKIMRYQYKLDGFDKSWQDVFGRKTAYFTKLPAGHFVFRVRAYYADQLSRFAETSITVVRRPVFYSTWWFFSLIALAVCLLVVTGHLWKVRQVDSRFRAILEERSRVAREVHDTLIQGCASVSAFLEASSNISGDRDLKEEYVNFARSQISITMDEARRTVWNLRHGGETQGDIRKIISDMADQMSKEFGVTISCTFRGRKVELDSITLHEATMIVREALMNALLHGDAGRVEIVTRCDLYQLSISVRDDGKGFDDSQVSDKGHYGLKGMRERTTMVGGAFSLQTGVGNGTVITFTLPLAS
jgi:signal transduction histidine kinase/ligand-binding sensor domain-containing protein